jgi:hypothetical protein
MPYIVVTPVNTEKPSTEYGKKAKTDYLREKEHSVDFKLPTAKWDDSKCGNGKENDFFAFVHQKKDLMEIFFIREKIDRKNRPDYWDIEEHRRRDVIILSEKIGDMKWSSYKKTNGYKENFVLRGTVRMKFSLDDKSQFQEMSDEDKKRFSVEMKDYKPKKKKVEKPKKKFTRAKTAYQFFCEEMRPELKGEGFIGKELTSELNSRWKDLKEDEDRIDELDKYNRRAQEAKEKKNNEDVDEKEEEKEKNTKEN